MQSKNRHPSPRGKVVDTFSGQVKRGKVWTKKCKLEMKDAKKSVLSA